MTPAEQNWRDGRPEDARPGEDTGPGEGTRVVEQVHDGDPLVEEVHEDPMAEEVHEDPMAERAHEDDPLVAEVHEDPLVEQVPGEPGTVGNDAGAGREPGDGRKPGDRQRPGAGQDYHAQLAGAGERERFVARWQEIQAGFVDEPRKAVLDADALVADLVQRLAQLIASEREQFESLSGGGASTEELRQGLQRYRSLFERLLAV
jgi:hypothetical protein